MVKLINSQQKNSFIDYKNLIWAFSYVSIWNNQIQFPKKYSKN